MFDHFELAQLWVIIPRTLLGINFLMAAIDGLSHAFRGREMFAAPLSPAGKEFHHNLASRPLLWGTKATIDLVASIMLLLNFHAPLAVLLILPTSVVVILFQIGINKVGIPIAVVLSVLLISLGVHYMPFYTPLLHIEDGRGPLASAPYGHAGEVVPATSTE
jgi:hypothetical protein